MKNKPKLFDKFDWVALAIGCFGICLMISILVDSYR